MNHEAFAQKMQNLSILYVEDDDEIRHYITSFLERYCQVVYACNSAEIGLDIYETHQPDILLLDINLGGMSGVELATHIRRKDVKTPILISTAYTNKEFMLQAIELSLTRYLVKPMTNDDLVTALEKCWTELQGTQQILLSKIDVYHRDKAVIMHPNTHSTLRNKEVALLELFLKHEGEVVKYDFLEYIRV